MFPGVSESCLIRSSADFGLITNVVGGVAQGTLALVIPPVLEIKLAREVRFLHCTLPWTALATFDSATSTLTMVLCVGSEKAVNKSEPRGAWALSV